jgi:hypothetical protein
MSEWRVVVNNGQETLREADGLYDVITVDTFNPFGDFAKAFFDDQGGQLFDIFERGTQVELEYATDASNTLKVNTNNTKTIPSGTTETFNQVIVEGDLTVEGDMIVEENDWERDFVGFVVNSPEPEADGANQLEIEAYRFDQFLRGDTVSSDLSGQNISSAIETVIKNDVPPVDYNASLVDVEDDFELERSYQGDPVEEFLLDVQLKSANEVFRVTDDLEFEFQRPERTRAPRDIDNTQWITHNIGEEGGDAVNQVTVFYNDGNDAVTVDNSSSQLNTQDNLNSSGPAQEGKRVTRPDIGSAGDATDVAERILERRGNTLTGTVTTFDLIDAQPGQVIDITVDTRGIDGEFRIAENRTRWLSETNELTVVQKKGADDDILIEQSRTLDRVQNRPADNAVTPDRVTDTRPAIDLDVSLNASVGATKAIFVNGGLNRIRDGLVNENEISNVNLLFSANPFTPVRSSDSLGGSVERESASVQSVFASGDAAAIEYEATTDSTTDVRLIGFEDAASNTLLGVILTDGPINNETVEIFVTVTANKSDNTRRTTADAHSLTRDILGTGGANFPEDYAYGDGTSDPSTSDSSLDNRVVKQSLTSITLDQASTTSDFQELL